jgi:hypothetical protein
VSKDTKGSIRASPERAKHGMRQKAEAEAAKVRRVVAFKAELDEDRILAVISRNVE